jgi:Flp pilus assembly protein TadD
MALCLFGATLLLHSRCFGNAFLNFDDPVYVTANPDVRGGLSWAGLVWAFTAMNDYWHPLTWLSHMLDWQLYGEAPAGHHVTSVLWHSLNASLVFLVFRRLAGGFWSPAIAAAFFAWHPLRIESVAWITERKDVMSGCFFLLTLLAYTRYADMQAAGRHAWKSYLLALASFALGLMSKPMLVSVPLVLLLLDFWPLRRASTFAGWRGLLVEKIPFFVLSAATAILTVLMQRRIGAFVLELPLGARLGNAVVSIARYLGKTLWPFDLIVCYSHPGFWPVLTVIASVLLLLALCALAGWRRREQPALAAGLGWFLITLLPVIGILQVGLQAMADRYTYIPMLGLELSVLGCLPVLTAPRQRFTALFLSALLLAGCAWRSWDQQAAWHDSVSLFRHAVACDEANDMAQDLLSSALFAEGQIAEAKTHAARAVQLNPCNDQAVVTLASIAEQEGRQDEATRLFRRALELRPGQPRIECQLALHELALNNLDRARSLMSSALRTSPDLAPPTLENARNARSRGDPATAWFLCEVLLAVVPEDPGTHAEYGLLLMMRNDLAAALPHLRLATARLPGLAEAQLALAYAAASQKLPGESAAALQRAEEAAKDSVFILKGAADLRARRGEFSQAIMLYRRIVTLAPSDARTHFALGSLLLHEHDLPSAQAELGRALELDPNLGASIERLQRQAP